MAVKVTMIAIVSNNLDIGGAWKLELMFFFLKKYFLFEKNIKYIFLNIFL
jgi:hypothetical protein